MNRRNLPLWAAWLLPFFCLRALLPAGFMPVVGDAGLRLMLCDGQFYTASLIEGGDQPVGSQVLGDSCPFALASTSLGPAPTLVATVAAPKVLEAAIPFQFVHTLARPLPRAQQPRGPPYFS